MLPGPGEHGIPCPKAFPDAAEVAPWILQTDSIGFLHYESWPWLYSYSVGWLWLPGSKTDASAGLWVYLPK